MKKFYYLWGLFGAIVILAGITLFKYWHVNNALTQAYVAELGQSLGPPDARKTLVAFIDYQCPFCRQAHGAMRELVEQDPDVQIIYRHVVTDRQSMRLADMALAAALQDRFAQAHEYLMTRDVGSGEEGEKRFATVLGLDPEKLQKDMRSRVVGDILLRNLDMVETLKLRSAPSYLIGGKVFIPTQGMPSAGDFRRMLNEAYEERG